MKTMKKIGQMAFMALFLTMSSCSSDDGDGGGQTSDMATYIFATVNGEEFKTYELNGHLSAIATKEDGVISIYGVAQDESGMTMGLTGITEPGTYPMSANAIDNRIGYSDSDITVSSLSPCDGVSGTVVVTFVSATKIEGTFTMTANDSECSAETTVTNGSFRGTFTE